MQNQTAHSPKVAFQTPVCCTLPETGQASDFLASFVSLKDFTWIKLGICIILAGQSMVWGLAVNLSEIPAYSAPYWALHGILAISSLIVIGLSGKELFWECFNCLRNLRLGIESLFTMSLTGAFLGSLYATFTGNGDIYYEVVIVVIVIYSFGRKIGQVSKEKALHEANRFREQFDYATVSRDGNDNQSIRFCELAEGETAIIRPGNAISFDGLILEGEGYVRETPLTGEPHPVLKKVGDRVQAGTWSLDATFTCQVELNESGRMIDRILEKVESSISTTKSIRQIQAESWIQWFVVFVCAIALGTGIYWSTIDSLATGWLNSMSVLLIACPCALGLATPLAIWTGLWQLSSYGIVSRASHFIDSLANTKHFFFDKTGTLTEARLQIGKVSVNPQSEFDKETILKICTELESGIDHPIARAFQTSESINESITWKRRPSWVSGKGVQACAVFGGSNYELKLGTEEWMKTETTTSASNDPSKRIVLTANDKQLATIELVETLRNGVEELIHKLKQLGIRSTILTGDPHPQWSSIANASVRSSLSPEDKAELIKLSVKKGEHPIFVGDGINDLNAMSSSYASISINDGGASLTQSSSSAILVGNNLTPIYAAVQLAKRIDKTLYTNLIIAASYNLVGMSLAATGILHPVASALIMIVSSLLVTFRAIRKAESFGNIG